LPRRDAARAPPEADIITGRGCRRRRGALRLLRASAVALPAGVRGSARSGSVRGHAGAASHSRAHHQHMNGPHAMPCDVRRSCSTLRTTCATSWRSGAAPRQKEACARWAAAATHHTLHPPPPPPTTMRVWSPAERLPRVPGGRPLRRWCARHGRLPAGHSVGLLLVRRRLGVPILHRAVAPAAAQPSRPPPLGEVPHPRLLAPPPRPQRAPGCDVRDTIEPPPAVCRIAASCAACRCRYAGGDNATGGGEWSRVRPLGGVPLPRATAPSGIVAQACHRIAQQQHVVAMPPHSTASRARHAMPRRTTSSCSAAAPPPTRTSRGATRRATAAARPSTSPTSGACSLGRAGSSARRTRRTDVATAT
jgi:hypothetical protein